MGYRNSMENYRPYFQTSQKSLKSSSNCIFMDSQLSKQQFRKGCSTQYCLLVMLEKWKNAVDNGKFLGALLTDLSKAFECLSHELLIAKLHAYGFDLLALKPIQSYLSNRKQRTKINATQSSWEEILFGVPVKNLFSVFYQSMFFCVI